MPEILGRLRTPRLASAPASPAPGELYFDTGASALYWWNGTAWVSAAGGGGSSWVSALSAVGVLDVGMVGQIRAGRQLTAADFTALGLSAPAGLWNLSSGGDSSGNNRTLGTKGSLQFNATGINGVANTAAQFTGNATQNAHVLDAGSADALRIGTGSWGCWFRTAKRAAPVGALVNKRAGAGTYAYEMQTNQNTLCTWVSVTGSDLYSAIGTTDVCDDRWHFGVATFDGTTLRTYLDGAPEASVSANGSIFPSPAPLSIGNEAADSADSANGAAPHYGAIDEAFVTADVLSADQIRYLYCAKIPHTLAKVPVAVSLGVRRWRRGGAWIGAFPVGPGLLRLHNFYAGNLGNYGSLSGALVNNGGAVLVADADGLGPSNGGAFSFNGAQSLSVTDAGLPAGLAVRSYGCWLKTISLAGQGAFGWGTYNANDARIITGYPSAGYATMASGSDQIAGAYVADGQWHLVVVVEDNAALDGIKRKLYVDGRLTAGSTVMNSITLAGANRCRVGANQDGSSPFTGQIDSPFVWGGALTGAQVMALYASILGEYQVLPRSPKDPGAHIEAMDASNIYAIFDSIETQHTIDLAVGA